MNLKTEGFVITALCIVSLSGCSKISKANFKELSKGMSLAEVEALLGPSDVHGNPVEFHGETEEMKRSDVHTKEYVLDEDGVMHGWYGASEVSSIRVYCRNNKVTQAIGFKENMSNLIVDPHTGRSRDVRH